MNIQEIKKLLEMFDNSNSVKLKITNENFEISLEKSGAKNPKSPPIPQFSLPSTNIASVAPISNNIEESVPSNAEVKEKEKSVNTESITSPMVGTFYRAPSPDSAPYVNVGDKVKKGQTIAIIEAMKIMNEIEAEFDCKIVEIVANDAQSVEFSTVLFQVEKI
ncbi:acetyl-CoA carboxylase, biotin carboxyl carrier protein [Helicobacter sp. 16-1353]|uniref:acetyl-CoA carboxylase biotin carboxyl carrier protein n=1 Tax=Helicobacter sp. 16-1353 TaxID=2004996 RepID=UPI000DCB4AC0|nr:acetyl-CoA carboxylase biotin carboxyl carrier protein [Helicobacter sp. 16-1353]RAX53041.1 acetyl-CoA carboxylase, biotin carboxyl carrier protein [Helicobacter sp. 16-1353]